jgi:peptidoglycan/xylan/chitin deacetylase (PgdA/CDA1 family)
LKKKIAVFLIISCIFLASLSILAYANYDNQTSQPETTQVQPTMSEPVLVAPATPKLIYAKNSGYGVKVKWQTVENAEGYNIYRRTADTGWVLIATVNNPKKSTYTDKTAVNSFDYFYTVDAFNKAGRSGSDSTGVLIHYISAPVTTIENSKNGVVISWTQHPTATKYKIYKRVEGASSWKHVKTLNNATFTYTDKNIVNGERAYYGVAAVENTGVRGSLQKDKFNVFISAPVIKKYKNTSLGVKVYWEPVAGAEKYRIIRKTEGGKWEKVKTVSAKTLGGTDKNAVPGVKYYYSVKAIAGSYTNRNSAIVGYKIEPPKGIKTKLAGSGVKISWQGVQYADYYAVYRKDDAGNWTKIHSTKNNSTLSYTDKNVASGVSYTYTVATWYKKGKSIYGSEGNTIQFVASPKLISAIYSPENNVTVTWSAVNGAVGYKLYKKEVGGKYAVLTELPAEQTTFVDTAVVAGKEYAYVVKAKTLAGTVTPKSNSKKSSIVDPNKPMIALTFDDGPSSSATTRILNVLEANGARATFFVVGSRVDSYSYQIKRAYDLKCEIGNHSYGHSKLTSLSVDSLKWELSETDRRIQAITGVSPVLMRPPGGSYKTDTVRNNTPYPIIMWSIDTRDWESRNATAVVNHIKATAYDGAIILMHDLYDSTATATEMIVPWLISQGYQLVTVSEMMEAKGIKMQNGVAYSSAR